MIIRQSLTGLRNCYKTFSEKTRTPVAWYMTSQVLHSARRSNWNSSWKCRPDPTGKDELSYAYDDTSRDHCKASRFGEPSPRKEYMICINLSRPWTGSQYVY